MTKIWQNINKMTEFNYYFKGLHVLLVGQQYANSVQKIHTHFMSYYQFVL